MIISELSKFWSNKEAEWGREITVNEVAKETKLDWETVNNLKKGVTNRYDGHVIGRICDFFKVPEGNPAPFLILRYGEFAKQKPTSKN